MDYQNYNSVVDLFREGSTEALMSLVYETEDGEEVYRKIFRTEEIKEVWPDYEPDEIEGVNFDFDYDMVIANVCIAQGQGNILLVWDLDNDELIHLSRCAYAEKSVIRNCEIYTLCDFGCYGLKQHLCITKTRFEVLDIFVEGELMDFRLEPEYSTRYNPDDFFIRIVGDEIEAGYKEFSGKCKI